MQRSLFHIGVFLGLLGESLTYCMGSGFLLERQSMSSKVW